MKTLRIATAVAALALSLGTAHAGDYWNRSGFALDHKFHSPFDNMFRYNGGNTTNNFYGSAPTKSAPATIDYTETDREAFEVVESHARGEALELQRAALAKAISDQYECRPIVIHTDTGVIYERADGCRAR